MCRWYAAYYTRTHQCIPPSQCPPLTHWLLVLPVIQKLCHNKHIQPGSVLLLFVLQGKITSLNPENSFKLQMFSIIKKKKIVAFYIRYWSENSYTVVDWCFVISGIDLGEDIVMFLQIEGQRTEHLKHHWEIP